MIEVPVHNKDGQQVDTLAIEDDALGGEVRPALLKQAYVYFHANRRQGSSATRSRGLKEGSARKLYRQKGTGNARRGAIRTNLMRGGGVAFAKKPKSWRQKLPEKMRRLANRNALLAKIVDGELKIVDSLEFEKPSTRQFSSLLKSLEIDRACLAAFASTATPAARSANNLEEVTVTHADRLNAFDLLNHRYVLADKATIEAWVASPNRATDDASEPEAN